MVFGRAITENGYTRSVWSQKRVQAGIKSKIHSTSRAIGQNKSYPFFRDYDPGTTVNGYYARSLGRLSTVSEYLLLRVFVLYLVVYGFGRYFLLFFGLYLLFKFFTTSFISLYSTIMRTCLRRSIYCLLYTSPSPRDKRQSRMPSSA